MTTTWVARNVKKENMTMADSKNQNSDTQAPTETVEFVTPTELAKAAGVRPQVIYNLGRQGYILLQDVEVVTTQKMVAVADAQKYLQGRADRAAAKAAREAGTENAES